MVKYAIYGFFFSKNFSTKKASFYALGENIPFWDKVKKTQDKKIYNLSGYLETSETDLEEFVFTMEAVLTFVQQQDVRLVRVKSDNAEPYYESSFERHGSGAPFAMFDDLQKEIVEKLYIKLTDDTDLCNRKGQDHVFDKSNNAEFKSLVYKVIEPFHMRRNYIEMTYFLYFSGLEAFCKQYLKSFYPDLYSDNAPRAIGYALEKMDINYVNVFLDVTNNNLKNKELKKEDFLKLSVTTYTNLRNALFHSNKFVADTEISSVEISKNKYSKEEVQITDYEYNLHRLCNVVILKYIGIENKRLDCNKWYTRLPLIRESTSEGENN